MRILKQLIRRVLNASGYDIVRAREKASKQQQGSVVVEHRCESVTKIHYGCGQNIMDGWLNVDMSDESVMRERFGPSCLYARVDLARRHPFVSDCFRYGFAEDFLEHLDQADALFFLSECYRTFQRGGVLRLSFPSLEGVLRRHYRGSDGAAASVGKDEAYLTWGHRHFFSRDELACAARHIGYQTVEFVEYGTSAYEELCNLDTRPEQKDLNIYVELTK